MLKIQVRPARNQSVECTRLLASILVVFIHCPFPGEIGGTVTCLARFAVPMFFVISGYYAWGQDAVRIKKRLYRVLGLNVTATVLYGAWKVVKAVCEGERLFLSLRGAVPTGNDLVRFALLSVNPYAGHLWYLAAAWTCWLILWGYVRFWGNGEVRYGPFYRFCAGAGFLQFLLGELAPMLGVSLPYMLCRNAFLTGLPMFAMGLFLREYGQRLTDGLNLTEGKLAVVILLGAGFSLLCAKSVGGVDLPIGIVIAVAALMLLAVSHPKLSGEHSFLEWCISQFGTLSASVYILHLMVMELYDIFLLPRFADRLGSRKLWIRPVAVLGITLAVAVAWELVRAGIKRLRSH